MKTRISLLSAAIAVLLSIFSISLPYATAEDQPAKVEGKAAAATPESINQWIHELDSNSFTERQTAARKLAEAGKDAVEPLGKAAAGDSLEVTRQAVDILRRHFQSGDAGTKEAATTALKKLAEGDNKSAASRATEILKQAAATANQPNVNGPGLQPGIPIQIQGGIGRIQLMPAGGAVQRIQVQAQNNNGEKSVEVDENGKKIKIKEDKNGIKVTTTENVNGQEKTETTEAKDLDELKKKNAEAGKLYEKYAGNAAGNVIVGGVGGAIQIQINGQAIPFPNGPNGQPIPIQIPGNAIPAIPLIPAQRIQAQLLPIPNPNDAKQTHEILEKAKKNLQRALEQIKTNPDGAVNAIEAAQKELGEAQAKLQVSDAQDVQNAVNEAMKEARKALEKRIEKSTDPFELQPN